MWSDIQVRMCKNE